MDELLYVPGEGLLYRLDPRSKFLFVISLSLYVALESTPHALIIGLLVLHALCLLSKGTRTRVGSLWKRLAPLVLTIVLFGSLRWRAAEPWIRIGPVTITIQSLWMAVGMATRIAGLSFGFSILLWTTEPGDVVAGLTRLGLPFELGFPVVMALQYVATFRRLFNQILDAQQSRGMALPRGNPIRVARAYVPVLVPLIISALRSVDSLTLALQSRGFNAGRKRTSRRLLRIHTRDWVFVVATWCLFVGLSQV